MLPDTGWEFTNPKHALNGYEILPAYRARPCETNSAGCDSQRLAV
jgi:hypothetical protein